MNNCGLSPINESGGLTFELTGTPKCVRLSEWLGRLPESSG